MEQQVGELEYARIKCRSKMQQILTSPQNDLTVLAEVVRQHRIILFEIKKMRDQVADADRDGVRPAKAARERPAA